jgi:hypothetical protein
MDHVRLQCELPMFCLLVTRLRTRSEWVRMLFFNTSGSVFENNQFCRVNREFYR